MNNLRQYILKFYSVRFGEIITLNIKCLSMFSLRAGESGQNEMLSKAEDLADKVTRNLKHVLPHLARFCLASTFFEDGLYRWVQWDEQVEHMDTSWGCGWFLATTFVLINLVGQLGAVAMVLTRIKVDIACGVLFFVLILQTIADSILWDLLFLFRNLSLIGALLLVLAESRVEDKSLMAGVPNMGENKPKMYLQLAGRILLIFMFLTLLRFEMSAMQIIQNLVGLLLMVLVTIGYKTKLSALVLITWLNIINFYFRAWWTITEDTLLKDFVKYDFFQALSVIGGLLMVVSLGPGEVSMDEQKKNW